MATNTYVALDKATTSSSATSITFSAISGSYTDLMIVANHKWSGTRTSLCMQFNADTNVANYSDTGLYGNGASATSGRETGNGYNFCGLTSDQWQATIFQFQNYSNTTTYKTSLSRGNSLGTTAASDVNAMVHLWKSTTAITSIKIYPVSGNFIDGSTFSLYGILAEGGAKATGGVVTSDSTYYYHTFLASGTFTPLSTLSCDYLVVAGGGGASSGGAGAGGYRESTLSVSSAVTVTVGAGGAGAGFNSNPGTQGSSSVFSSITSAGGGGGGQVNIQNAGTGGSGGGGARASAIATVGAAGNTPSTSPAQGFAGGNGNQAAPAYPGGGGGGSSAVGVNAAGTTGGNGGAGTTSSINGTSTTRAGGGGGATDTGYTPGSGGSGGGGVGTTTGTPGAGTVNTGSGGGGSNNGTGGAGGSGIVIVRYAK